MLVNRENLDKALVENSRAEQQRYADGCPLWY